MNRDDLIAITKDLAATTREFVASAVGEFAGRLKSVEDRIATVKDGEPGQAGDIGPAGIKGDPGPPGEAGQVGAVGPKGDVGPSGDRGEVGLQGEKGDKGLQGPPGRDADPVEIEALKANVASLQAELAAVKASPDIREMVKNAVTEAIAQLPVPTNGRDGADGTPADPAVVLSLVSDEVSKAVAALPRPQDGAAGKDGASVDPVVIDAMVAGQVERAVAAIPRPLDGRSVTVDDVAPRIVAEVGKAVAAIPAPKDGTPGENGKDGVSLAGALLDRDGNLVVTLSSGETKTLGHVVGTNGTNGADGINLDFFTCEVTRSFDPETRLITDRYVQGDRVKEVTWKLDAAVLYRGVYQAGRSYEAGDAVTWGSSLWVAKEATSIKPDEHSAGGARAWQMAVRKGGEGKQGAAGPQGPTGAKGDQGDRGPERW